MYIIEKLTYTLLLSFNPCNLFDYYDVEELHGLYKIECLQHANTSASAYIAGLSNFVPKENGEYLDDDKRFIYINLTRCTDDLSTITLIMHETMHHSMWLHNYDVENQEEEIITWAEEEAKVIYNNVQRLLNTVENEKD